MAPGADLHKNIRLPKLGYLGHRFYFVTMCCHELNKTFGNPRICEWLRDLLRAETSYRDFAIHAYCLMPDHLHFLAEGRSQTSDLLDFVKSFKIKTSRIHARKTSQPLWQKKYFDHILRTGESPESVAWYIWMNPVRGGMSSALGEYPFSGSFTGLMERLASSSPELWTPPWKPAKAPASEGGRYRGQNKVR